MSLTEQLRRHDWYHMMSDDHSVAMGGYREAQRLSEILREKNCPHQWWDIEKALSGSVVEDYDIITPDGMYRKSTWKYTCIASQRRCDLITREEQSVILKWLEENDEINSDSSQDDVDN